MAQPNKDNTTGGNNNDPRQGMEHHSHFPRVYLIRHGETEWSLNGRHTGTTDIPLTARGEQVMRDLGPLIVGKGKLLDPRHLSLILISPRSRAQNTFQLLFEPLLQEKDEEVVVCEECAQKKTESGCDAADNHDEECAHRHLPSSLHPMNPLSHLHPVETCDDVQEWKYGDFEGRKSKDIRKGINNMIVYINIFYFCGIIHLFICFGR